MSPNTTALNEQLLAFSIDPLYASVLQIDSGLINNTYKVIDGKTSKSYLLQRININVFSQPEDLQTNYSLISDYLQTLPTSNPTLYPQGDYKHQAGNIQTQDNNRPANYIQLPKLIKTGKGKTLFIEGEGSCWRMFEFINNSYVLDLPTQPNKVYEAAQCFGNFTTSLRQFDAQQLKIIIPNFHNLHYRYTQFQQALVSGASAQRQHAALLIQQFLEKSYINQFYHSMQNNPSFKKRVMHHDAKLSNILFNSITGKVICPIDMDTVMPGYFFSDPGDMIRTMACSENENSTNLENIYIKPAFYTAIVEGYMQPMGSHFTPEEKDSIHASGLIMIYQQGLRFLTDYLSGNQYYKTSYKLHNYDRAMNQYKLLLSLEEYVSVQYGFKLLQS